MNLSASLWTGLTRGLFPTENCPKKAAVLFQYNTFIINLVLDVLTDLTSIVSPPSPIPINLLTLNSQNSHQPTNHPAMERPTSHPPQDDSDEYPLVGGAHHHRRDRASCRRCHKGEELRHVLAVDVEFYRSHRRYVSFEDSRS